MDFWNSGIYIFFREDVYHTIHISTDVTETRGISVPQPEQARPDTHSSASRLALALAHPHSVLLVSRQPVRHWKKTGPAVCVPQKLLTMELLTACGCQTFDISHRLSCELEPLPGVTQPSKSLRE